MRTMILALAVVLLAAPVWADVTITLTKISETEVEVGYEATGERPRAFALDVTVTEGTVTDVTDFVIGDDNGGFGIFPANFSRFITVNDQTGEVDDWGVPGYTPVADGGDPGAQGGLDTNGVTLEMGALYDTNQPLMTGVLCRVTVEYAPALSTELCVNGNALRGNVVLEDATEVVPVEACITLGGGDCFPSSEEYEDQYADWVAYEKPDCWCNSAAIIGREPTQIGDRQCYGDADGGTEGALKYRVSLVDLNLIIANWKKRMSANPNPCADIDHKSEGALKYRVSLNDLNIVIANWKKRDSALSGDCPHPDS
jgi:hypothetical protein